MICSLINLKKKPKSSSRFLIQFDKANRFIQKALWLRPVYNFNFPRLIRFQFDLITIRFAMFSLFVVWNFPKSSNSLTSVLSWVIFGHKFRSHQNGISKLAKSFNRAENVNKSINQTDNDETRDCKIIRHPAKWL